ncbi:MAG: peptidoglycan DD-metalloendopeptidase family protein [Burkholderiales bacterium]|nr:peptidoglycan DD-metalloendopeptidase family protein [Burkholderiales bacterium]
MSAPQGGTVASETKHSAQSAKGQKTQTQKASKTSTKETEKASSTANKKPATKSSTAKKSNSKQSKASAEAQRDRTQEKIKQLEASISQDSADKKTLEEDLKRSEADIQEVRGNLKDLNQQRRKVERDLNDQLKRKKQIEAEMAQESKILDEITKQMLEQSALKDRPDWLGNSDPNHRRRVEMMLEYLAQQSANSYKRLEEQQAKLSAVVKESRVSGETLRKTVSKERQQQDLLAAERAARQKKVVKLERGLALKEKNLKQLQADEKRLTALMVNLDKQSKVVKKGNSENSNSEENKQTKVALAAPASVTGLPVVGKVAARYGQKRGEGGAGETWKGMVFSVASEVPVKAVRSGKVVFSDYLRGYGNLLIIDHGGGYFTVYGNNSSMNKDIGDSVKAGEVISHVGSKDSDLSVLYFELRHNGKPIDPAGWLKL